MIDQDEPFQVQMQAAPQPVVDEVVQTQEVVVVWLVEVVVVCEVVVPVVPVVPEVVVAQ